VTYSGNAYRLTLPEQIASSWDKAEKEKIPICFFQTNSKIILEPADKVLDSKEYSDEIVERVKNELTEYLWRKDAEKCKELREEYIKGKYTEVEFRQSLDRHFDKYQEIWKKLRAASTVRGLQFAKIENIDDLLEMELVISESEKDEKVFHTITFIQEAIADKQCIFDLLKAVQERMKGGSVSKEVGTYLAKNLEKELLLATKRLDRIKDFVCSL
jgi:hypothetical protein